MNSQSFDSQQLAYMRRRSDRFKFVGYGGYPADKVQWAAFLSLLQQKVSATKKIPEHFSRFTIKRKSGLTADSLEAALILRKVNDNIRRAYGIKQPSRSEITHEVAQLLRENTTKHLIKIDIRSFFESVPVNQLYRQLEQDRKLSTLTLQLLADFLRICKERQFHGLPRGLSLSATLAELHVRDLDRQIRAIPGVYHVNRYVDDIIVFCFKSPDETRGLVRKILKSFGLRINSEKHKVFNVHMNCEFKCPAKSACVRKGVCQATAGPKPQVLDFLGYAFEFKKENAQSNSVSLRFSARKITTLKTRMIRAFGDYRATGDVVLLGRRIKYLAGNHKLKSSQNRGRLRAGVFYSYMQCDVSDPAFLNQLKDLDVFLRTQIYAATAGVPHALSPIDALRLVRISFAAAVAHRITNKAAPTGSGLVKECWKYG